MTSKSVGVTGVTVAMPSGRKNDVTSKPVRVTAITIAMSSGPPDSGDASGSAATPASAEVFMGAEKDTRVGWSRPLDKPVEIPGGMTLKTLAEVGAYVLDLPEDIRQRESWRRAADLLLKAASGEARVEDVTAQIERALCMELTLLLSGQKSHSVWE